MIPITEFDTIRRNSLHSHVKKLWVDALRSGDYAQTTSRLQDNKGFCCLGVLCDIYRKQVPETKSYWDEGKAFIHPTVAHPEEETRYIADLPRVVADWAGLFNIDPLVKIKEIDNTLATHNDKGKDFGQIATAIEEQL